MKRQAYTLELLDDVVLSQSAATAGDHASLDYVPGQTLLGACAATLYRRLDSAAYAAFHSGRLRFGGATPLGNDGAPAWPVPLAWHVSKEQSATENGRLIAERIVNNPYATGAAGVDAVSDAIQYRQLREGYVDASGCLVAPDRRLRMKTAIDPDHRRAATAQLFGYQALARGTRLGGFLEADDDLADELWRAVVDTLTGELLIGRSRSSEYGRAYLARADFAPPAAGPDSGRRIVLWLLSDLCMQDGHGQPTLEPEPEWLGLGPGRLLREECFLRSRVYAPWNAWRHAPDLERWVIQQGSVLAFKLDAAADDLAQRCAGGLGLHRECGLGRVWLNPPLLATRRPAFAAPTPSRAPPPPPPPRPDSPLLDWLQTTVDSDRDDRIEQWVNAVASDYRTKLDRAARERGLSDQDRAQMHFGPSRTHWGTVQDAARRGKTGDLMARLFRGDSAAVKDSAEGWSERYFDPERKTMRSLCDWLRAHLKRHQDDADFARRVAALAHRLREDATRH